MQDAVALADGTAVPNTVGVAPIVFRQDDLSYQGNHVPDQRPGHHARLWSAARL
jgi:hypothetical protein